MVTCVYTSYFKMVDMFSLLALTDYHRVVVLNSSSIECLL